MVEVEAEIRMPGEEGIWVFIFGDLVVFSLFFGTFLYYRRDAIELFNSSQEQLSQAFGLFYTVILLSSSWLVATGLHAARLGRRNSPTVMFLLAFICGAIFIVTKIVEYSEKIQSGIALNTNDFFMYYFVLTGVHAVHVIIGMGVLGLMAVYTWSRRESIATNELQNLESGAIFWHLVDLLWIVLFALLYLVN